LQAGERATFLIAGSHAAGEQPEIQVLQHRLLDTARFWKTWIAKSKYKGRWREMVHRSALLLKLLINRK
jgi:GH15 family glucan-1,4-alpha-glucosidase